MYLGPLAFIVGVVLYLAAIFVNRRALRWLYHIRDYRVSISGLGYKIGDRYEPWVLPGFPDLDKLKLYAVSDRVIILYARFTQPGSDAMSRVLIVPFPKSAGLAASAMHRYLREMGQGSPP